MVIHYELILLYVCGFSPKDCIRYYGYSRGTAYRFHRIYRDARKRLTTVLAHRNSVTPEREHKTKHLDALRKKKGRPPAEKKPVLIRRKNGEYDRVML
jgi:hypothetical protein